MIAILVWVLIAFGVSFHDGYFYQNEPNFFVTFLAVVVWGVLEQMRWCVVNGSALYGARSDPRWDQHFKTFAVAVFLASFVGSLSGFNLSP